MGHTSTQTQTYTYSHTDTLKQYKRELVLNSKKYVAQTKLVIWYEGIDDFLQMTLFLHLNDFRTTGGLKIEFSWNKKLYFCWMAPFPQYKATPLMCLIQHEPNISTGNEVEIKGRTSHSSIEKN